MRMCGQDYHLTDEERTREKQLTEYFTARIRHLTKQSQLADGKAVEFQVELQKCIKRLDLVRKPQIPTLALQLFWHC